MKQNFSLGDKVRIIQLRKESIEHTDEEFLKRLTAKIESKAIGTIDGFYLPNRPNITFGDLKASLWDDEIEKC